MKEYIKTVKKYNEWRRGVYGGQPNPKRIGDALDEVVKAAERYELLRTLTPQEFKRLSRDNIGGSGRFDELVDKMIEARK